MRRHLASHNEVILTIGCLLEARFATLDGQVNRVKHPKLDVH